MVTSNRLLGRIWSAALGPARTKSLSGVRTKDNIAAPFQCFSDQRDWTTKREPLWVTFDCAHLKNEHRPCLAPGKEHGQATTTCILEMTFERCATPLHQHPLLQEGNNLLRSLREKAYLSCNSSRLEPDASHRQTGSIWALGLTYVGTNTRLRPLLGVIDHGTRTCLPLQELDRKTTVAVLRVVLDLIDRFGPPTTLRTDNEATFTSRLFGLALWLLGIRHQRTVLHAPWQNGRIERFFGTLKQCLRELRAARPNEAEAIPGLRLFRLWYNHVRPHQNLQGLTPAEAWKGETEPAQTGEPGRFQAWSGVLSGFYVLD